MDCVSKFCTNICTYICVYFSPKNDPRKIWPPTINRVHFPLSTVPNMIALNNRTWKELQSKIVIFQLFGQDNLKNQKMRFYTQLVVDTKTHRTWFYISICRDTHKKNNTNNTDFIYYDAKNCRKKMSFTIKPAWDAVFLPCYLVPNRPVIFNHIDIVFHQ